MLVITNGRKYIIRLVYEERAEGLTSRRDRERTLVHIRIVLIDIET